MRNPAPWAAALCLCGLCACATISPKKDYDRVSQQVETATGQSIPITPEDSDQEAVQVLLRDGLTTEEATQLCLINNPGLLAELLKVGIGRAEVVQSGLFTNPSLALSLRFPDEGGLANFEVSLAQNIAELWQIKHRKKAAESNLDHAILSAARTASLLALSTREAYVRAVRADRELAIAKENVTLSQQLVELTNARTQAGSGTEVDVNLARAERLSLDVQSRKLSAGSIQARSELAKLLGLDSSPADLQLVDVLPETIDLNFAADDVINTARVNRLDLQAARSAVTAAESRLAYERARVWKNIDLGISMERTERRSRGNRNFLNEAAWASAQAGAPTLPSLQPREAQSTDYVTGPTISAELPLFDQNRAQIARAQYELLQATFLFRAIERDLVQESWAVHAQARAAFENASFMRDELLPLRERGLQLTQESYRVGGGTILTVIATQRALLEARANYVEAQALAAESRIALERIAGRPFGAISSAKKNQPENTGEKP